jgi:hypothetical protein
MYVHLDENLSEKFWAEINIPEIDTWRRRRLSPWTGSKSSSAVRGPESLPGQVFEHPVDRIQKNQFLSKFKFPTV